MAELHSPDIQKCKELIKRLIGAISEHYYFETIDELILISNAMFMAGAIGWTEVHEPLSKGYAEFIKKFHRYLEDLENGTPTKKPQCKLPAKLFRILYD